MRVNHVGNHKGGKRSVAKEAPRQSPAKPTILESKKAAEKIEEVVPVAPKPVEKTHKPAPHQPAIPRNIIEEMKHKIKEQATEMVAKEDQVLHPPPPPKLTQEEQDFAKLCALTIEVRGGGVAGPFEAVLTNKGARDILEALKK